MILVIHRTIHLYSFRDLHLFFPEIDVAEVRGLGVVYPEARLQHQVGSLRLRAAGVVVS